MFTYLIKMIVCSALLFLYYFLFLRNKKFHSYNRFYLLAIVVVSLIIPFLRFEWFDVNGENTRIAQLLQILYASQPTEEIIVSGDRSFFIDWISIAGFASLGISMILLFIFGKKIFHLLLLKRKFPEQRMNGFNFINTNIKEAPFSFLKNLFWRNDLNLEGETENQILRHELAHIQQKHSWDRIFLQITKSIFWFNPIFYFIEKELILIHEYIADEKAIENKDGRAFAAMLLRCKINNFNYSPGQAIFYSSIKKRLQMLTNNQKTNFSYARRLLVLPLLGCVTFAFGFRAHKAEIKATIHNLETQIEVQKNIAATDTLPPLQGKVSGVKINKSDTVTVVAKKTKTDAQTDKEPLIIIDDEHFVDMKTLKKIPANEIESVTILKDESAISLYGEKGKNGVVIVKTKQEKQTRAF